MSKKVFILLLLLITAFNASVIRAQVFTNYTTSNGLPSNNVNGVAVDNFGNVWFATDEGVASFDNTNWTVYTTANGLVDNYINCIAVDASNHVWVGTDNGVSTYTGTAWITYTNTNGLCSNMISYIACTPNGDVWIGTNNGVSRYTNSSWVTYNDNTGLPGNMISYIRNDIFGNVWIGTWITGLAKFDGTNFTVFTTAQQLVDNNILSIAIDKHGNKYLGTYAGITVLDSLDQWKENYNHTDGLYNNYIQDLAFDSRNVLWAGIFADYLLDGAVNCWYQDHWYTFGVPHGLVDVQVKRIAVDYNDNIWVATGAGVSKLTVNNLGDADLKETGFNVYPNPAKDVLSLDHTGLNDKISIYDFSGKAIDGLSLTSGTNTLDISGLSAGVYMMRVDNGKMISSVKFIKQ